MTAIIKSRFSIVGLVLLLLAFGAQAQTPPPPPLANEGLKLDIPMPAQVWRVDSRNPAEIFRDGFSARGSDASITDHVRGGRYLATSTYISTTENEVLAATIASSSVNDTYRNAFACSSTGEVKCRAWIYVIRPSNTNFFAMGANLPDTPEFVRYRGQWEWAAVGRILPEQIISAYPVIRTFRNGRPLGDIDFNTQETRTNPAYNENFVGYVPPDFSSANVGPTILGSGTTTSGAAAGNNTNCGTCGRLDHDEMRSTESPFRGR